MEEAERWSFQGNWYALLFDYTLRPLGEHGGHFEASAVAGDLGLDGKIFAVVNEKTLGYLCRNIEEAVSGKEQLDKHL